MNAERPGPKPGPLTHQAENTPDLSSTLEGLARDMELARTRLYELCTTARLLSAGPTRDRILDDLWDLVLDFVPRTEEDGPAAIPKGAIRTRGDAELCCRFCGYEFFGHPLGEACVECGHP